MLLQTLGAAVLAALLVLAANYVLLRYRANATMQEERRAFVRQLHPETVALVVDLDTFVRDLRANAVAGPVGARGTDFVDRLLRDRWEGDLCARLRQVEFGHPDADVRRAAEALTDVAWPYMAAARAPLEDVGDAERRRIIRDVEHALATLKEAVYAAPHREVPQPDYKARAFIPPDPVARPRPRVGRPAPRSSSG